MITKELREYVWKQVPSKHLEDLISIADRIEGRYEECEGFARRLEDAAGNREYVTLFGVDYFPLPKDADGETIHLGDHMSWDNGTFNVHELNLTADGWTTWDELHGYTVRADQCHHVQPDSWERIISDATAFGAQMKRRTYQIGDFVERCKKLAGEQ